MSAHSAHLADAPFAVSRRFGRRHLHEAQETAMPKVIYSGNGSTSGSVPVDGNTYNAGDTITVLGNTGGLGKGSDQFAYWNTAANGSGSVEGQGATFTIGS